MLQQYKKTIIAAIALSLITFFLITQFGPSLGEMGVEITHINHFN